MSRCQSPTLIVDLLESFLQKIKTELPVGVNVGGTFSTKILHVMVCWNKSHQTLGRA